MDLLDFLIANPVDEITKEVKISNRIDGVFKIKAMTSDDHKEYQSRSKGKLKKDGIDFDSNKFNLLVCVGNTVEPNFRDAEILKKTGCATPTDFIKKVLLAGEIASLAEEIITLSGFNVDINEDIETAKN